MRDDTRAALATVLGGFGSPDTGERANAAAAADDFLRKLGLNWNDVVDAIEHMSAVENWQAGVSDRAPRADTEWIRFVDPQNRAGYGRWRRGQALTVREHRTDHHPLSRGGSYFGAVNGNALYRHGKPMLFRDIGKAQAAVEKHAAEALEFDSIRRSK
jgi:hypothetical protein